MSTTSAMCFGIAKRTSKVFPFKTSGPEQRDARCLRRGFSLSNIPHDHRLTQFLPAARTSSIFAGCAKVTKPKPRDSHGSTDTKYGNTEAIKLTRKHAIPLPQLKHGGRLKKNPHHPSTVLLMKHSMMLPNCEKNSFNCLAVVDLVNPPTNNLPDNLTCDSASCRESGEDLV